MATFDPTKPVQGSPTTQSVRDNFVALKALVDAAGGGGGGGGMAIVQNSPPTNPAQLVDGVFWFNSTPAVMALFIRVAGAWIPL